MISELAEAMYSLIPRFRATTSTTSSPAQWFIDWATGGNSTDCGVHMTAEKALTYAPVYQAVSVLAGDVGQLPLDLYARKDERNKEKAKTHPAYRLVRRRANPFMSAGTFRETMMYYTLFWGNGCAEIEWDNGGRPRNLWPLLPDRTSLEVVGGMPWYITRAGDRTFRIRPSDVLHIRNFGFDGLWGYSTLALARNSWALGLAAGKYAGKYFKNNGMPSGVLEHPEQLGDEAYKRLRRDWASMHEGLDNTARIAILEEGVKFSPTAFNHKDAQWLEGRQFSREEAAAWFNLPPHKIGAMEHATFSNIEEQNRDYLNTSLMRWLVKWQDECDEKLLTTKAKADDTHFFEFNTAALLRGDLKSRYEAYAIGLTNAFLNPNEVRDAENKNAYDGGDEYRSQMNMEPASKDKAAKKPDAEEEEDTTEEVVEAVAARIRAAADEQLGSVGAQLVCEVEAFRDDVARLQAESLSKFSAALETMGTKLGDVTQADLAEEVAAFRANVGTACVEAAKEHASELANTTAAGVAAFKDEAAGVVADLMHETVGKATIVAMLRCEINRVRHAAKTAANFCGWLDTFYDAWPDKVAEGLDEYAGHPEAIAEWAAASKAECLEVAGTVTDAAGLEEGIALAVATWPQRAEGLAAGILTNGL